MPLGSDEAKWNGLQSLFGISIINSLCKFERKNIEVHLFVFTKIRLRTSAPSPKWEFLVGASKWHWVNGILKFLENKILSNYKIGVGSAMEGIICLSHEYNTTPIIGVILIYFIARKAKNQAKKIANLKHKCNH